MNVRPATEADAAAVRAVGVETWPSTYAYAGPAYVEHGVATWWSAEAVLRGLRTTATLVAEDGGEVVGMGNLDLRTDPPTIWKLYVRPPWQGTGAGSALMTALLELAGGHARLEYTDGNERAAAFYRRHGFAETGREPGVVGGRDAVWMERRPA